MPELDRNAMLDADIAWMDTVMAGGTKAEATHTAIQTYLEKTGIVTAIDKVHALIVSPDFRVSGGLVKVSSLKEALDG